MRSVMVLFHCESNTGYAIGRLEPIFYEMALRLCDYDSGRIHFAYPSMRKGKPDTLPSDFNQCVVIDSTSTDPAHWSFIEEYVRSNQIDLLFGFDQPVHLPTYRYFRRAGIKEFVSYWGAPMSSIFGPIKRTLKRLEVAFYRDGPNRYIFESQGMADTAIKGRGIAANKVRVVHLGVDHHQFRPDAKQTSYIYEQLGIPRHRRIFFYSGHMEERKGVWVIMNAANYLATSRAQDDWHIVLVGNQPNEEQWLTEKLSTTARTRVTFGGYRSDINLLHRGCYAGIIASTGWDSLTCSSLEMQASGLPLIVSDLPGLKEAIDPQFASLLFEPGNHERLSQIMCSLLDNDVLQRSISRSVRERIIERFTTTTQIENLVKAINQ